MDLRNEEEDDMRRPLQSNATKRRLIQSAAYFQVLGGMQLNGAAGKARVQRVRPLADEGCRGCPAIRRDPGNPKNPSAPQREGL